MQENKATLRRFLLHCRQLLDASVHTSRCHSLSDQLLNCLAAHSAQTIHSFLPIERNKEVDTLPPILEWRNRGGRVIVSATNYNSRNLTHFWYDNDLVLQNDKLGIPTPATGNSASLNNVDAILVPLLGVDQKGHRLGYGGGYYDELLSSLPTSVLKIGLSLGEVFDRFTFVEPHDIALDFVITPTKTIRCNE